MIKIIALILSLMVAGLSPSFAADVNIDGLPAASSVGASDLLECEQSGTNRKCTPAQIATYLQGLTGWATLNNLTVVTSGTAGWQIIQGPNGGTTLPVPTLYPTSDNKILAFDLSCRGICTDIGYGVVWNDMCTTDQIQFGNDPTACLHLSSGTSPSGQFISSATYSGGTPIPLYFTIMDGTAYPAIHNYSAQVNINGTWQFRNGVVRNVRTVTAAGAVTVTTSDDVICINKTVGAATAANLFAAPDTGSQIEIKDCKGDAGSNNITVTPAAGNIDGAGTAIINTNYGKWRGVYTGSAWSTM